MLLEKISRTQKAVMGEIKDKKATRHTENTAKRQE